MFRYALQKHVPVLKKIMWVQDILFIYSDFGWVSMMHGDFFIETVSLLTIDQWILNLRGFHLKLHFTVAAPVDQMSTHWHRITGLQSHGLDESTHPYGHILFLCIVLTLWHNITLISFSNRFCGHFWHHFNIIGSAFTIL